MKNKLVFKTPKCTIYKIYNTINNKVYIGQTWQSINIRFSHHKSVGDSTKLSNAFKKYDVKNFNIEAIFCIFTQKDANYYEQYFIEVHDSIKNGYNIKEGGSNGKHSDETKLKISLSNKGKHSGKNASMFGKHHTDESKEKIRIGHLGKKHTEESKLKMSIANSGENSAWFGKTHTDETKLKMSKAASKLPLELVHQIRDEYENTKILQKELAIKYNLPLITVNRILRNITYNF